MTKETTEEKKKIGKKMKIILISSSVLVSILLIGVAGVFAYSWQYEDRIHPNIFIGNINVGGLSTEEANILLQEKFEDLMNSGLFVNYEGKVAKIDLRTEGGTDPDLIYDYISIDLEKAVNSAFNETRDQSQTRQLQLSLNQIVNQKVIDLPVVFVESRINSQIREAFKNAENPAEPTKYSVTFSGANMDIEVEEGTIGREFDFNQLYTNLQQDIKNLELSTHSLEVTETANPLTREEVEPTFDVVQEIINRAPYTLEYTTDTQRTYRWNIQKEEIANWLTPVRAGESTGSIEASDTIHLTINGEALKNRFSTIRETIDISPIDAKFEIVNGRVTEFRGSEEGVQLDEDSSKLQILLAFADKETRNINLEAKTTPPNLATGDVNDLGIKEVIGTGWSDFSGSPANRIANIRHGANKLNGLLIAPGEQISLVQELKPFTVADGYLPELVIKGDEIIPEVGGGLCQIGTSAFRAVMNTGLQIDERRNHSLVVSYYNDPSNGNPGTDATLYDPAPDFKFTNDTDHHILLTTDVNVSNGRLTFTFWGTSDGRNGYYTPPVVNRRWSPGPTEYKVTKDLPPGRTECQAAYTGVSTSFDYIVEYADGSRHEHTYNSQYRALPRICLVGYDPKEEGVDEDSTDEEETQSIPTE